ncbi:MAG: hypothetical protein IKZ86_13545 [Spirochaetaceae bacterium]|nr:hypothetical protein [Spirochaetaceae bacterium]
MKDYVQERAFGAGVQRLSVFVKQFLQRKNRHFSPYELQYKIKLLRKEFRLAQNLKDGAQGLFWGTGVHKMPVLRKQKRRFSPDKLYL